MSVDAYLEDEELGIRLAKLAKDRGEWSQKTFGRDNERGPLGPLKRLAMEVNEAVAELYKQNELAFQEELADCLLLLLDATRRGGLSLIALVALAEVKMVKNKGRKWPPPRPNGEPVEHIRETDRAA